MSAVVSVEQLSKSCRLGQTFMDTEQRGSKRQKDLADIARILENHASLRSRVPQEILSRLVDDSPSN